jgi:hypothetical protein
VVQFSSARGACFDTAVAAVAPTAKMSNPAARAFGARTPIRCSKFMAQPLKPSVNQMNYNGEKR